MPSSVFRSHSPPAGYALLAAAASFRSTTNFHRARGEGRHLQRQKNPVSKVATLSTSLHLHRAFRAQPKQPNLQYYGDFTQHSHACAATGSAALISPLCPAVRWLWELTAEMGHRRGVLLVEEAGGQSERFAGRSIPAWRPSFLHHGLIHEEMCAMALEISRRSTGPLRTGIPASSWPFDIEFSRRASESC